MDPEKAQNQIIDAIKLQRNNLEKANQLAEFDPSVNFKNQLNQNVELYPMLFKEYGFDNLRSVMTLPNLMIDSETHQHYPILTTYYIMLLIGIVFFFSDKNNLRRYKDDISVFEIILSQILEENAITGIVHIITKDDLENLKQARTERQERYIIKTLPDYNKNNIVNSVYIKDNESGHVFQSVIMPDSFSFDTLNKLLAPSFPLSDIRTDFIRNKSIYSISNTGVKNYLNMLYSTPSTKLKFKTAGPPVAGKTSVTNPIQISKKFSRRKKTKGGKRKRLTRKVKRTRKGKKTKRGASVPMRYVPRSLSEQNKATQRAELKKSRKAYKQKDGKSKGKNKYYTRKKMPSFQSKVSPHVIKARKVYGVEKITPSAELAKATKCSRATLRRIEQKGQGAYYSSGSRPNQTAHSWGRARLASAITGGKASAVDLKLLEAGCDKQSKALKLAKKAKGYGQRRVPQVKL